MTPPNSKIALLFPGQGSQSLGMGQQLAADFPVAQNIFQDANQTLGIELSSIAWQGPQEELDDTLNTQPALMVHSYAALRVLQDQFPDLQPAAVAGHSMGELSSLIAAGALEFKDGLQLVRRRGELMQAAGEKSPGGMAAILGLSIDTLEQICTSASRPDEIVQIANDNCPGQVVISGANPALERAMGSAKEAGARRVVKLAVSIAAHSPLMEYAQDQFSSAVAASEINDPQVPVIGNVNAQPLATIADIEKDLRAQLNSRVRWTESIQYLVSTGITTFIEVGNNTVLTGLLKRIDRSVQGISFGEPQDLEKIALL
ncbi:MAG: ACP S-malonyltransferase [Anaerolineales bacterium]|nr:ACP S-malonyltransferase [Anaerolineales bacterium]